MNLPKEFTDKIQLLFNDQWCSFERSLKEPPPISIRINPIKTQKGQFKYPVKWSNMGFYLEERPSFTFDPLFHAGCYYPQEASSMFIEQAISQCVEGDVCLLDLCAAPGGKSTHLASLLSMNSLLVANEVIRSRANILSENIQKSGYPNVVVTNNDPADFSKLGAFFDVALVDAPCSGEGMFRKDNNAIDEWSTANVQLCKERQQRILANMWSSLKPNGILIYSTCTYNTEENEDNVSWICSELGAEAIHLNIPENWGITGALKGSIPVYRFLPHKTKGEGFFMAVLRKTADTERIRSKSIKKEKNKKEAKIPEKYKSYISNSDDYDFKQHGTTWTAFNKRFTENHQLLQTSLRIVSYGINIGEEKGKDFIPNHSLALSCNLNRDSFSSFEVDWITAIAYLRKEAIFLGDNFEKGYVLITYKGTPLGFVKNIGNRANNLYPPEWRIRSTNIPNRLVSVLDL